MQQDLLKKTPSTGALVATDRSCVVRPQQTEGPYFVDVKLHRSDIRPDPSDDSVKEGVPLRLVLRVSRMEGGACAPLAGAVVDVWHCDALGIYSDVQDQNGWFDTRGKKFLRGYQLTDASGTAEFMTIYPGWYQDRTPHIHFKIRNDRAPHQNYEFTSQIYFEESVTDRIHMQAPYAAKGRRPVTNDTDRIFSEGGTQLIIQLARDGQGYVGTFDIALS